MTRNAFLVTKPFQLIVCLGLIKQFANSAEFDLIVTDDFYDAQAIVTRLKLTLKASEIRQILFFKNQRSAYVYLTAKKYDSIFIDSDVGLRRFLELVRIKLNNSKTCISVYEEGVGTFRSDLYPANSLLRRLKILIFNFLGIGTSFGGNFLVSRIFLFTPAEYHPQSWKKTNVIRIASTIEEIINNFERVFEIVFELPSILMRALEKKPQVCAIYLSSWTVDNAAIEKLRRVGGLQIVKLHPHIKNDRWTNADTVNVHNAIPAEILLGLASKYCQSVTVFHHGSSVTRYISRPNLQFVEL